MHRSQLANFKNSRPVDAAGASRRVSDILVEGSLFAIGVLSNVVVHLIGDLFVAELIMLVALPFASIFYARRLGRPGLIRVGALLGAWLIAQIISDAYNQIELLDRMRGMALITFFGIEMAFFAMFLGGNERRKAIFLTGFGLGSVLLTRFQPNVAAVAGETADNWKWAYAFGITLLALLASSFLMRRGRYVLAMGLPLTIAAADLILNFRSAFLMLFITIVLVFPIIPESVGRLRILPRRRNLLRIAIVAMLAIAGGWSANKLVQFVSQAGFVSDQAKEKNESEAQAGNLLVGGRPEFFVGLTAALESPIVGHGSWAKDMKYLEMQHDMLAEYGLEYDLADMEATSRGLIPSHSHLIGAWVFSGFAGALFWVYIFSLVLRAIVAASVQRPSLALVYVWMFVGFTWNILFSPFGSTSRIIESFTVVAIVDLLNQAPIRIFQSSRWKRKGVAAFGRSTSPQAR